MSLRNMEAKLKTRPAALFAFLGDTMDSAAASLPSAAPRSPPTDDTQPAKPVEPVPQAPSSLALASVVAAIAVALVASGFFLFAGRYRDDADVIDSNLLYGLAHIVPSTQCIPVPIADIKKGTARFGTVDLAVIRASLKHHMRYGVGHGGLQAISAAHFDRQNLCVALVNVTHGPADKGHVVEMYNLRIITGSVKNTTTSTERSIFCKEPFKKQRVRNVLVEYWDHHGDYYAGVFTGPTAIYMQQVDEVQSALASCTDSNIEVMLQRMQRDVHTLGESMIAINMHPQLPGDQLRLPPP